MEAVNYAIGFPAEQTFKALLYFAAESYHTFTMGFYSKSISRAKNMATVKEN